MGRICPNCQKPFETERPTSHRKFCLQCLPSVSEIGQTAYKDRWRALRGLPPIEREVACRNCGKMIERRTSRKFCVECLPPIGEIGSKEYKIRWQVLNGFSSSAYMKHWRVKNADRNDQYNDSRRRGFKNCKRCGEVFALPRGQGGAAGGLRYCSLCGPIVRAEWAATRANAPRYAPSVAEIAIRDGWTCHICGKSVDPELLGSREPEAPSRDHLTPVAYGGTWELENLALAHRSCNSERQAPGLDFLTLESVPTLAQSRISERIGLVDPTERTVA